MLFVEIFANLQLLLPIVILIFQIYINFFFFKYTHLPHTKIKINKQMEKPPISNVG